MTEKKDNIKHLKLASKSTTRSEEPTLHKVSDKVKEKLISLVSKLDKETSHKVSDAAIACLTVALETVLDGMVDDVGVFVAHSQDDFIEDTQLLFGFSEYTQQIGAHKFMMLHKKALKSAEEFMLCDPEGNADYEE